MDQHVKALVVLAASACLWAAPSAVAKSADPHLLQLDQFDPAHFLPPPPVDGSPRALAELAELRRYQADSTPEQRAAAKWDNDNQNGTIFASVLGSSWDLSKLPATAKVVDEIIDSEGGFSGVAKKVFHRNRPWVVASDIQTCAPHHASQDTESYPSGHTTLGYGMGIVLADLMPGHAQAILGRVSQYAENRMVCGFHFRSDIVAGQEFGTILALRLMQNSQFQNDMAAARTELQSAGLAP